MRLPKSVNGQNIASLMDASMSAAANWFLSSDRLLIHAILTASICCFYSYRLCTQLYKIEKIYSKLENGLKKTCGVSDKRIMSTFSPVFCTAINVFLIGVYTTTGNYQNSDIDPKESKTNSLHSTVAVLAIILPYIIHRYISLKYPLRDMAAVKEYSDEALKTKAKDSEELAGLKAATKSTITRRKPNNEFSRFFNSLNMRVEYKNVEEDNFSVTLSPSAQTSNV